MKLPHSLHFIVEGFLLGISSIALAQASALHDLSLPVMRLGQSPQALAAAAAAAPGAPAAPAGNSSADVSTAIREQNLIKNAFIDGSADGSGNHCQPRLDPNGIMICL